LRLWSIHPSYLDQRALVAVWREGLLARAVLRGATRGYRHHPQLARFRSHSAPVSAINNYLRGILLEAQERGYNFDKKKIGPVCNDDAISVTSGQLLFELAHLRKKVSNRAPLELARLPETRGVKSHPLFKRRNGPIEGWERGAA
jgi:hypothetical protein